MTTLKGLTMASLIVTSQLGNALANTTVIKIDETKSAVTSIIEKLEEVKSRCELKGVKVQYNKSGEETLENFSCKDGSKGTIKTYATNFRQKVSYRGAQYNCSDYNSIIVDGNEQTRYKGSVLVGNDEKLLMSQSCKEINDFNK